MGKRTDPQIEQIEHIVRQPIQRTFSTPLLFLHGAWHGAWCWELFLDFFCSRGYEAHAISLPGHGKSSLHRGHIDNYTFDDYVECLSQEAEHIAPTPIVIGHSLGGALLQVYLEEHRLPGAVLLASLPAEGFMRGFLRWACAHPLQALKAGQNGYAMIETPELAAANFLSANTSLDMAAFHTQLVRESKEAGARILRPISRHPESITTPLLVLAGGRDAVVSVMENRRTAELLHAKLVVFPESPHDLIWNRIGRMLPTPLMSGLAESSP